MPLYYYSLLFVLYVGQYVGGPGIVSKAGQKLAGPDPLVLLICITLHENHLS